MMSIATPQFEQHIERIAQEIERYLQEHPGAGDSIEGVTHWWLTRQRYQEATSSVQKALDLLVVRGRIEKIINYEGASIYRRKKTKDFAT